MQIVQELCKRPGLNRTGFDMPTIYIPNPNKVWNISYCPLFSDSILQVLNSGHLKCYISIEYLVFGAVMGFSYRYNLKNNFSLSLLGIFLILNNTLGPCHVEELYVKSLQ